MGGNYQTGCDAVGVRRPESSQVAKMADSSGRVSKSSGSSTGKGAVSAEQVSIRERRGQLGRCRVRAGNGVCGLYRPSALSTFSVSHSRREAITTPARACGGGCAEESHVRRLQREPSGKALSCGSWEGVQGPKVMGSSFPPSPSYWEAGLLRRCI